MQQWKDRVWCEFHAFNLTPAYRDVLLTLATFRGRDGACFPSHETLAARTRRCVSTVQGALKQARKLGLVHWGERRVRVGWRWLRTSNRYWLTLPEEAVTPGLRPVWPRRASTGKISRGEKRESKKGALQVMLLEAAKLPNLLVANQARIRRLQLADLARRSR